jgi:heme/copper-type cytochrome/quinol oxidase subunit 3
MATLLDPAGSRPSNRPVRGLTTFALIWFIGGLAMLFIFTMAGYLVVRTQRAWPNNEGVIDPVDAVPIGALRGELPHLLWASTAVVLAASVTIQLAVVAVEREKLDRLIRWARVTLGLGILFCLLQIPAMASLLQSHQRMRSLAEPSQVLNTFGLIFCLVLLHALHVVGGLVHLVIVERGATARRYDHESHAPVKNAAIYWHFLDVVWLFLFATLYVAG